MLICRGWRWRAALRATLPVAAVALSAAVGATAQTVEFSDTTLENGLRVIIAEDHVAPVVSIAVNYDVGSRNERRGRTGFAHLFEHMMFEGSENVGDGEHFLLVANNGGDVNGTTDKDRTLYFERMPSNQLELGLFLGVERLAGLARNKRRRVIGTHERTDQASFRHSLVAGRRRQKLVITLDKIDRDPLLLLCTALAGRGNARRPCLSCDTVHALLKIVLGLAHTACSSLATSA